MGVSSWWSRSLLPSESLGPEDRAEQFHCLCNGNLFQVPLDLSCTKRTQEGSFRLYGPLWKLGRRRHRWHGGVLLLLASGVSPSPCPPFLEICIPDGAAVVYRELTQQVLSLPWILRWNVPALFVTRRIADARQVAVLRVLLAPPSCGHRWGPSPTKVLRPNIHEEDTRYSEVTDVVDGFGGSWH